MAPEKSLVPGLSRGLEILRLLATPMTVEEIVRHTRVPKSTVRRILVTLAQEGLVVRDPKSKTHQAAVVFVRSRTLAQTELIPGDSDWHSTPGQWCLFFLRNGIPCITTYGDKGDADMGLMWRFLPSGSDYHSLRFNLHGGHAHVMLVRGGAQIPVSGDIQRIRDSILAGRYGEVLAVAQGPDSNENEITVTWDLSPYEDDKLKLVIIDALNEPWGFVSVSRFLLQRSLSSPVRPSSLSAGVLVG